MFGLIWLVPLSDVGRMSIWLANYDIPRGENYVDVKVVSDVCSGITTPAFAFGEVLGKELSET